MLNIASPRAIGAPLRRVGVSSHAPKSVNTTGFEAAGRGGAGAGHDRQHVQRIVDADAERLRRQRSRPAGRVLRSRLPAPLIVGLRGEQSELEVDDLLGAARATARRPARGRSSRRGLRHADPRESPDPCTVSRPSHITALRKPRFVVGSGRRYIDASVNGAPQSYGSSTSTIVNSAFAGTAGRRGSVLWSAAG